MKSNPFKKVMCAIALMCVTASALAQDFESERKRQTYELAFMLESLEDAGESGRYGIALHFVPWELAPKFYAGAYVLIGSLNYGFQPASYVTDRISLGPSVSYYITPKIFISMPITADCWIKTGLEGDKFLWGMSLAPRIYLGKSVGLYVGPMVGFVFKENSDPTFGLNAGIYF